MDVLCDPQIWKCQLECLNRMWFSIWKYSLHLVTSKLYPIYLNLALPSHSPHTEKCPRCEHPRAYFMQLQTRSADEPMTTFYKCCNPQCGHQWREWTSSTLVQQRPLSPYTPSVLIGNPMKCFCLNRTASGDLLSACYGLHCYTFCDCFVFVINYISSYCWSSVLTRIMEVGLEPGTDRTVTEQNEQ